jgi:hypothetical protein
LHTCDQVTVTKIASLTELPLPALQTTLKLEVVSNGRLSWIHLPALQTTLKLEVVSNGRLSRIHLPALQEASEAVYIAFNSLAIEGAGLDLSLPNLVTAGHLRVGENRLTSINMASLQTATELDIWDSLEVEGDAGGVHVFLPSLSSVGLGNITVTHNRIIGLFLPALKEAKTLRIEETRITPDALVIPKLRRATLTIIQNNAHLADFEGRKGHEEEEEEVIYESPEEHVVEEHTAYLPQEDEGDSCSIM